MPEETTTTAETEEVHSTVVTVTEDNNNKTDNNNNNTVVPNKEDPEEARVVIGKMKVIALALTILTFFLSFPIMFAIIYLLYIRQYDCEDLLGLPKLQLIIALGLVLVFIVSNVVVFFRSRFPIPGLLIVMILLIIALVVGLGLVGAYKIESRKIPASPPWLKSKIHDESTWPGIKSCIYETRTCKDLFSRSYLLKSYDFIANKLSFIEAGCCTPPAICEMEYVNATYWMRPANVTEDSSDEYISDCNVWENKESILCYNCNACKDSYLRTLKEKWLRLGAFLIAISLLLTVSHILLFVATICDHFGN